MDTVPCELPELTLSQRLARWFAKQTGLMVVPVDLVTHWHNMAQYAISEKETLVQNNLSGDTEAHWDRGFHDGASGAFTQVILDIKHQNPA